MPPSLGRRRSPAATHQTRTAQTLRLARLANALGVSVDQAAGWLIETHPLFRAIRPIPGLTLPPAVELTRLLDASALTMAGDLVRMQVQGIDVAVGKPITTPADEMIHIEIIS